MNKFRGEAMLEVEDGEDILLIFDFNALCEIESATGLSPEELMKKMQDSKELAKFGFMRALLYGAMKRGRRDLALEDAGDIISSVGPEKALRAMTEAMQAAFPAAKEGEPGGAKPPARKSGVGTKR